MKVTFELMCFGKKIKLKPVLHLYTVNDFLGRKAPGLCIELYSKKPDSKDEKWEPFCVITKSFGEFIGVRNAAYIDLNNCPFAKQLCELGFAEETGFYKNSGFCQYPLWVFNEAFLRQTGDKIYSEYSECFDSLTEGLYCG